MRPHVLPVIGYVLLLSACETPQKALPSPALLTPAVPPSADFSTEGGVAKAYGEEVAARTENAARICGARSVLGYGRTAGC